MLDVIGAYSRRLASASGFWTKRKLADGLEPIIAAGLVRSNGILDTWYCECPDAEECGEQEIRRKLTPDGESEFGFRCRLHCRWKPLDRDDVERFVPDEAGLVRALRAAFGIQDEGESCMPKEGAFRLGRTEGLLARNRRDVFYIRSLKNGFDVAWRAIEKVPDKRKDESTILVVGDGRMPDVDKQNDRRRRTFALPEVLCLAADGKIILRKDLIEAQLSGVQPRGNMNRIKNSGLEEKAQWLCDALCTQISQVWKFRSAGNFVQARNLANEIRVQANWPKLLPKRKLHASDISRMKAGQSGGSSRFKELNQAIRIAQSYEMMVELLDNPESIPPFLRRFKPNAAPVNRAVAALSKETEQEQMQQVPMPSISPMKSRSTTSQPQAPKSEEEMSPEERSRDDAAFIKDMFGQTADDDGSETEPDGAGEYNPDDEN